MSDNTQTSNSLDENQESNDNTINAILKCLKGLSYGEAMHTLDVVRQELQSVSVVNPLLPS